MTKSRQEQDSGDNSTNTQVAGDLNVGLCYDDARQIALDIFKANFQELSINAAKTARERAEEITNNFLKRLEKEYPEGIKQVEEPGFQSALYNVQKEYACSGEKSLGDLLVDVLIERTKQQERTLEQLVLNEALATIPKLTEQQIAILSTSFLIRRVIVTNKNTLKEVVDFLCEMNLPFIEKLSDNTNCYRHLEYASCGSLKVGGVKIIKKFENDYGGLFIKGFNIEEIDGIVLSEEEIKEIIVECQHARNKYRINAINHTAAKRIFDRLGICDDTKARLLNLNDSVKMNQNEIKQLFIEKDSRMEKLFDTWEHSFLRHLDLTSVGIAIGHANVKKVLGSFGELNIWINE